MDFETCPLGSSRVLAVEDNPTDAYVLRKLLEKLGVQCQLVSSAAEAKEKLAQQVFDLVFMDAHLPDMHGSDLTEQIRFAGPNMETPVVAVTTDDSELNRARFARKGGNWFLVKPLSVVELKAVVDRWLPDCECNCRRGTENLEFRPSA